MGCPVAIVTQSQRKKRKAELQLRNSCPSSVPYHSHSERTAAHEEIRAAHQSFRDLKSKNLKSFQRMFGPYSDIATTPTAY